MNTKPSLIEPGTKYFLKETLKQVHQDKTTYDNNLLNVFLFFMFIIIAFIILNYKYKSKPNELEKKKKDELKKNYILNKIKLEKNHARQIKSAVKVLIQVPISNYIVKNRGIDKISINVVDKSLQFA